jgi:arginase
MYKYLSSKIFLNNIRCMIGQKKNGVQYGGNIILNTLKHNIQNKYIETIDINTLDDYSKIYNRVNDNISINKYNRPHNFNINLGGDHSISVGTIKPLIDRYKDNVLVVWIDAHGDINTYESSFTKNKHGMPLAALMGTMEHWYTIPTWYTIPSRNYFLDPKNIIYCGVRDLDPFEKNTIIDKNIKIFPNFIDNIISTINSHPAHYIHISFDVDSIDPSIMPSTGTLVKNGMLVEDVVNIINCTRDRLISFDLVEFNPLIGSNEDVKKTLDNIQIILDSVIRTSTL